MNADDQAASDENGPSVPAPPHGTLSRRQLLQRIGMGVAGAALAYGGWSKWSRRSGGDGTPTAAKAGDMTYRVNPRNGDRISLLGYGCMRFPVLPTAAAPNSPDIDEAAATALIDHAIENGVNFFDTAYFYHGGKSEAVAGNALRRHRRSDYFLNTKMPTSANPNLEKAKEIFADQLKRLHTDYFDYYLCHAIMTTENYKAIYEDGGVLEYLLAEKAAGRIRNLGFSFHGQQDTLDYLLSRDVDWDIALVQINYHDMLIKEYEHPEWLAKRVGGALATPKWVFEKMAPTNIPLMIMEPLLGGRLARLNRKAVSVLQQADPAASAASWALRYVGSLPNVLTVLSGMTYMEHLEDNLRTYSPLRPTTERDVAVLEEALGHFLNPDIIPCTACGYCMPCPYGVDIPSVFQHYNNCLDNGTIPKGVRDADYERARRAYLVGYDRSVPDLRQAERCTGCNICKPTCPQMIDIPAQLGRLGQYAEQLRNEV